MTLSVDSLARLPLAESLWWKSAAGFLVAFGLMWAASLIDSRVLQGSNVWAKPAKFAIATALHFATLAAVLHCLSGPMRTSPLITVLAVASVVSAIGEVGYISVQAARMQASHFNTATPFYSAMYTLMALGAVVLVAASGAIGVAAAVDGSTPLPLAVRLAIAIGLIGGSVLTLIIAFRLGANMSHHVGIEAEPILRMPITGWSLTVGDLRPPHFLATHMMQVIPVIGLVAARFLPSGPAITVVVLAAAGWVVITLVLFSLALSGRPFTALFAA